MTLAPWNGGKPAVRDVSDGCTTADTRVSYSAPEAGAAAELATSRKTAKYACLQTAFNFYPVAVETLGSVGNLVAFGGVFLKFRVTRETSFFLEVFCCGMGI